MTRRASHEAGRLPWWVEVVVSLLIRPGIVREDVQGDLTQAYGARRQGSRWRAALWITWQVASLALHRGKARLSGAAGRSGHEASHERRRSGLMEGLSSDIRHGARGLVRAPGFAVAAILTIGLGVGANAAIFSVVNGVLLRPLPWSGAESLVAVWPEKRWSGAMLEQVRGRTRSFAVLAAMRGGGYTLLGDNDAERVEGARVSDTYFDVLDVRAQLGRTFGEEHRLGEGGGVAVISHGLWQRRYGGDREIIGRTVRIAGFGREARTIIGVLPDGYDDIGGVVEVWTPIDMSPDSLEYAGQYGLSVIGRLASGRTVAAASAEMRGLVPDFTEEHPSQFREGRHSPRDVVALRENMIGNARTTLLLLLAAVGVVLLIACTNVANLLLARSVHRRREYEVRLALGARPRRIARQMLVESSLLGLAGGAAGVLIALAATPLFAGPVASMMPRQATSVLDPKVLLFATAVSLVAGLVFGSVTAVRFVLGRQGRVLSDSARGSTGGRSRHRLNNILVVAEVALAVLVVVAGSLLVKSFRTLIGQDPGFAAERVLAVQVALPEGRYAEDVAREQYFASVVERVQSLSGVESVSAIRYLPMTGSWAGFQYRVDGQDLPSGSASQVLSFNVVTPDYLNTLGVALLEGRALASTDRGQGDGVVRAGVINQAFRDRHWPGESAVGRQVRTNTGEPLFEVVGVVANIRQRGLSEDPAPEVYFTPMQMSWSLSFVVVRGDAEHLEGAVVDAIRGMDRDVPIISARTMDEVIDGAVADRRSLVLLFGAFAFLALALGMVGIYGLVSYTVTQRLREIGVRLALGATAGNVLGHTLARAMLLVAAGVIIGIGLALAGTRLLESMLFGVEPTDPTVITAAVLLMAAAGVVAALVPAVRAARSSPLTALRIE